jgi:hypothetical protein
VCSGHHFAVGDSHMRQSAEALGADVSCRAVPCCAVPQAGMSRQPGRPCWTRPTLTHHHPDTTYTG